jgi:hypothetical protein
METQETEDERPGFRLECRIVGPIKRSTLEEKHPDREWEAATDLYLAESDRHSWYRCSCTTNDQRGNASNRSLTG